MAGERHKREREERAVAAGVGGKKKEFLKPMRCRKRKKGC